MEQVRALREELNWLTRAIQMQESRRPARAIARIEKLRRGARECEQRLMEAMASLRAEDGEFAQSRRGVDRARCDPLGARDGRDAPAVLPGPGHVPRVPALPQDLKISPWGRCRSCAASLQLLRFQLSKFRLGAEYVHTFQQQLLEATKAHLREFYRQLIAPIART